MRGDLAVLFCVGLCFMGCAAPPKSRLPVVGPAFPAEAVITQRAVLSFPGRQFTLNGYLARSETRGLRLIVAETFGGVLADVLIKADGTVHVLRSSRAFKEEWIRRYVAADARCIFGTKSEDECPGRMLSPTHFEITRRWYRLDLRLLEVRAAPQPAELFEAP
jgi:hypothetical protein